MLAFASYRPELRIADTVKSSMTPEGYERALVSKGDRLLVRSTCQYCGMEILDSITDTLQEREEMHRDSCYKVEATSAE